MHILPTLNHYMTDCLLFLLYQKRRQMPDSITIDHLICHENQQMMNFDSMKVHYDLSVF
jgi:hypothetical protein